MLWSSALDQVIMAEVVVGSVLKFAGWVLGKGRDHVVKGLRDGDELDQKLAGIIASDINNINMRLDGTNLKDLQASICFYNDGVNSNAFDVVDSPEPPRRRRKLAHSLAAREVDVANFCQAIENRNPGSKREFERARERAVLALSNPALNTKYRILATYFKVMAQLLEEADDPERALHSAKYNLENMHRMEPIKANFETELKGKGIRKRLNDTCCKGMEIIWLVCHVNRVVFDIAQLFGGGRVFRELFIWPTIEIQSKRNGKEEIDVLRDPRIDGLLGEQSSVVWSFGNQSEEEDHKLKRPKCIATNTKGEFVVLDGTAIKMYDSSGGFLHYSCLPRECKIQFHAVDADTDREGNLYVLAWKTSNDHGENIEQLYEVFVFDNDGEFKNKFSLRNKSKGRKLALSSDGSHNEVLVLESRETAMHDEVAVYRYQTEGVFDRQFGKGILRDAKDIVSATDGRVLVLDASRESKEKRCVRIFDTEKRHLYHRRFDVSPGSVAIAFHRASQHIVIISVSEDQEEPSLSMYNINSDSAEPERTYSLDKAKNPSDPPNITVTSKGRIAIAVTQRCDGQPKGKVIVF